MDLILALGFLALAWALLAGAFRVLRTAPESAWPHRGGFTQFVALTSTGLLALGTLFLIRFVAMADGAVALVTVAAVAAVPGGVWLAKRLARRSRPVALPGGPEAPAV